MLFVYGLCNIEHILLIQDYVHLWGLLLFGKKHNGEKKLNTGTRSDTGTDFAKPEQPLSTVVSGAGTLDFGTGSGSAQRRKN